MYTLYYIRCRTPLHFYVGITRKPWFRWEQHRRRKGSQFTKLHGVIQVYRVKEVGSLEWARLEEWELVQQLRELHPEWVVRGAGATNSLEHSKEEWARNLTDPDLEAEQEACQ